MFENAAGKGEVGEPGWIVSAVTGSPKTLDDETGQVCQIFCLAVKDVLRNGISLCGALHHQGSEAGEIRCGDLIGETDERVEIGELPEIEDRGQKSSGAIFIDREEDVAQGLMADSVAGALVGQRGTPAASGS